MHQQTLEPWLKRRVWRQALGNLLVGLASTVVSLLVLSITLYLTFFVLFWIGLHILALVALLGWRTPSIFSHQPGLLFGSALFLVLLFIGNASTDREYLQRLPRVTWSMLVAPGLLGAAAKLITDLLFTGPRLTVAAINCFRKAARLTRFELRIGAEILCLLASKDSRVSFREICQRIEGINPVLIFPQFRDLEGIVFLSKDPAVSGSEQLFYTPHH